MNFKKSVCFSSQSEMASSQKMEAIQVNSSDLQQRKMDHSDSDLVLSGFTRRNYPHSIPVALLSLMVKYYTLWVHCEMSESQIEQILELEPEQFLISHLHSIVVRGDKMDFTLKMERCREEIMVQLYVTFQSDMVLIGGHFQFAANGGNCSNPVWRQYSAANTRAGAVAGFDHELVSRLQWEYLSLSELRKSKKMDIWCFLDLTKITFLWDSSKLDFDITPKLNEHARYRWQIKEQELESLLSTQSVSVVLSVHAVGGWMLSCYYMDSKIHVVLSPSYPPSSLNQYRFIVRYTVCGGKEVIQVKGEMEQIFQINTICFFMQKARLVTEEIDVETLRQNVIDLDIQIDKVEHEY